MDILCPKNKFGKTILIMKLTGIFLIILLLPLNALVYTQEVKLTLTEKQITIRQLLDEIETQTHFRFLYEDDALDLDKTMRINYRNEPVNNILQDLADEHKFEYVVIDENLIVLKKIRSDQQMNITGKVTDVNKNPLPGVNILEKGTVNGAVTDLNGEYSIAVNNEDAVLKFSFIGYLTEEISVSGKTTIDVVLVEDIKSLDEVVVIGYGTQKKSDLSAAMVSVGGEDLERTPASSFDQALQGKAAGVMVATSSGQPGGETNVRIRGYGSLNNSEPLYVVDGVILNSANRDNRVDYSTPKLNILSTVNVNDIESINILKDASATAIYGSRAGNGVVLITTKSGKSGQAKVNYDAYYGMQEPVGKVDVMNAAQMTQFSNEARINGGLVPFNHWSDPEALGEGTDWQSEIFRKAPVQNHQLSASGGTENNTYYISFGYMDQQGIIYNSDFSRYSLRINTNNKVTDRIRIGNNLTLSNSTSNSIENGNYSGGVVGSALNMSPTIPVYIETPSGREYAGPGSYEAIYTGRSSNPLRKSKLPLRESIRKRALGNLFVEYEFIKGLTYKANLGIDYTFSSNRSFNPRYGELSQYPGDQPINTDSIPDAEANKINDANLLMENTLTYVTQIAEKHSLTAMAGYTAQRFDQDRSDASSNNHMLNELTTVAAGSLDGRSGSQTLSTKTYVSYIGRLMYNFDSRYYLTANFRRDGSSVFGSNEKYANFPSFSAAWRISSESFMSQFQNIISDLKIRGSWGQSGVDGSIPSGVEYPIVGNKFTYIFNGQVYPGFAPGNLPNKSLRWETAEQWDIGFDLSMFSQKVQLYADYYRKRQFDIINLQPVPRLLGVVVWYYSPMEITQTVNGPEVINEGFELTGNYYGAIGKLNFDVGLNYTTYHNKIVKLTDDIVDNNYGNSYITMSREGHSLNEFYGFVTDGIITDENDPALEAQTNSSLGDIRFKDVSGPEGIPDGEFNDFDRTFIGSPVPDYTIGLNLNVDFNGFDFRTSVQGVQGMDVYNVNMIRLMTSIDQANKHIKMLDRWSPENPDGKYPRAVATDPNNNQRNSDRYIEDGSYLRVQKIELGYSLPVNLINKINMSQLRFYASVENAFLFTNYSGYDPDVGIGAIDVSMYPRPRTFLLGINVGF